MHNPKQRIFIQVLIAILFIQTMISCSPEVKPVQIIPQPVKIEQKNGVYKLRGEVSIMVSAEQQDLMGLANYLSTVFETANIKTNISSIDAGSQKGKGIYLTIDPNLERAEEYKLEITRKRIIISAASARGVFYGIQSLRQLLPAEIENEAFANQIREIEIPCLVLKDYPAFAYRGMHLDVARHFFPVSFIKKYLDLMALHKMNHFHWHLTEDQGWRIEIKQYPRLTQIGSIRKETLIGHGGVQPFQFDGKPYGGYYTQEEVREIVKYAEDRFITIIPEIEMPGHSRAALAAYPELGCTGGPYEVATRWGVFDDVFCAGNEKVFGFLENVLSEVIELFPSKLIHIGGDECPKTRWKKCPKCQDRIKKEKLADEYELQSYFIHRIENFLLTKDRNIIGWDEILEGGLTPNATVMSWRGTEGGIAAAKVKQQVIMTPGSHCYFDHYQADPATQPLAIGGMTTLEKVYSFNPIPNELTREESEYVLGAQGNVWTEYMKTPAHVEYMAYPRAIALAEVLWTPREQHNYVDFTQRLIKHLNRLDMINVNYFKEPVK